MARQKQELAKREPTIDDKWCEMAYEAAARDMAAWLKGTINTQRPINSLKLPELVAIATNVILTYIVLESERENWIKSQGEKFSKPPVGFV